MTDKTLTVDDICALSITTVDKDIIKQLIEIAENNPNDLLRVMARAWLGDNAVKLLKLFV